MIYRLTMQVPEDANPEGIASALERAAKQVREMSSVRAAHSMTFGGNFAAAHGIVTDPLAVERASEYLAAKLLRLAKRRKATP